MTTLENIRIAASNGLTRAEVIATVLGNRQMTDEERREFDKARGIWKLKEVQRKAAKRQAIRDDRARMAANRDAAIAIDAQLEAARAKIDWKRRKAAERGFIPWVNTYCVGVLLNDPPSKPHGEKILREMEEAVLASRPYSILVARGGGKTSYTECCVGYMISTGKRKFCLIGSINASQAQQIQHEVTTLFTSEKFAQDYPDIALPIMLLDGHGRRSQRQGGHDTNVRIVVGETLLPTITMPDGSPSVASGACIRAKALKSMRGTKNGTQRPDMIILDDLQTREIAENEERVQEVLKLIRGDVMGLAGKNEAAIISTATTISAEDMTVQLAADPNWKTTKNPAILSWPKEWDKDDHGLWGEYFALFDEENAKDAGHNRRGGSYAFYKRNRKAMDDGADILNWENFDKSIGQVSGLHKLMDAYHKMGHAAFMAEYQMTPMSNAFTVNITSRLITSRVRRGVSAGSLIDGSVFIAAATDINPSYALTTVWASFDVQRTMLVGGYHITPISVKDTANDTEFDQKIYSALSRLAQNIKTAGVTFDQWGIDAGGKQFNPVTRFAADAKNQHGLNVTAMTGRAGKNWNPNVKSKVRAALNDTVLCRDPRTGRKWLAFNADEYKEAAQLSWFAEVGAAGGCSLFDGNASHVELATQVANERLVNKKPLPSGNGYVYTWKTKEPHDYGDCFAMLYALAGADGLNGDGCRTGVSRPRAVCL